MKRITRCVNCIMDDSSDFTIRFDEQGVCNYCKEALELKNSTYFPNEEGRKKLDKLMAEIKDSEKDKPYDCIIGISGGLDSSYLAYIAAKYGLRALAIHIDDGYDTEISKSNIKKLIEKTGFEYRTVTPDEEQFNDLILAFMKAGVPNIAIPQDDILFAFLYDQMKQYHIRYFLSGLNFSLESILQRGNTHQYTDVIHIKELNRLFGTKPINKLKFIDTNQRITDKYVLGYKTVRPLNLIEYNRDKAFRELDEYCGFKYYGRKHLENILTGFVQLYWFPKKFGVDKRTSHLSSMIVSGQMTRDEAMKEYGEPLYDEQQMNEWIDFIIKKLGITMETFLEIMEAPSHQHEEYKVENTTLGYKMRDQAVKIKNTVKR